MSQLERIKIMSEQLFELRQTVNEQAAEIERLKWLLDNVGNNGEGTYRPEWRERHAEYTGTLVNNQWEADDNQPSPYVSTSDASRAALDAAYRKL